ncbi:unnamed protein product [Musa acuminata subsp. malaccensis]|uniref:(wild Malaysian banana) hypothetical protein n=1 Tax=Musa acuminata subsp. malaccensis TaxID=214687 RepID=A0A8D7B272_MUSAM|nr:unnamed protein product [Musa acuminata subsp. malaccensis]
MSCSTTTDGSLFGQPHLPTWGAIIHVRPHPPRGQRRSVESMMPRQACPNRMASGATCVQRLDGSQDSAIHTRYRISLRSSSMREPRYPLSRVIQ